jgi:hypothetical protein
VQHDAFLVAVLHREISLGTHGDDREIDRAQHLLCHGAEEQLSEPVPAPGSKKHSICLELADRGFDLPCGIPLAHQGIAGYIFAAGQGAPWFERLRRVLQRAGRIVAGHSGGVGFECRGCGKNVKENQPGPSLRCLLQSIGHEPVQIAQVSGDQDRRGMNPSNDIRIRGVIRHDIYLAQERVAPILGCRCACAHL